MAATETRRDAMPPAVDVADSLIARSRQRVDTPEVPAHLRAIWAQRHDR